MTLQRVGSHVCPHVSSVSRAVPNDDIEMVLIVDLVKGEHTLGLGSRRSILSRERELETNGQVTGCKFSRHDLYHMKLPRLIPWPGLVLVVLQRSSNLTQLC